MSALHASAARTTATCQAAPPVMRKAASQTRYAAPPIASLAGVPAGPAVQRKCAACDEEEREETAVQPRLEVGPVGDHYEQEADGIAAQVMAMPDPVARASDTRGAVQRACAACSSSRDDPRARRFAESEAETDEVVRARRDGGPETIAASDTELTSGGSELPRATRSFFEGRMGRDLGEVRVHQGSEAATKNDSISARAFTYKNHVWLGAGETASPSFTLAHELAHVMQQTAPGPVGPAPQRVQRADCDANDQNLFFAPIDGTKQREGEQALISLLTKGTGVIGEAPVPNATKDNMGALAIGKVGRADLMKTNNGRIVGLKFDKEKGGMSPRPWYSPHNTVMGTTDLMDERLVPKAITFSERLHVDGSEVGGDLKEHTAPTGKNSPPNIDQDAANAPSEVEIGEAKFGGTPTARSEARAQIFNYLGGIKFAHRGYENIRQNIDRADPDLEPGNKPKLAAWNLTKAAMLTSIPGGPEEWAPQGESKDLVIAKWGKVWNPLRNRDDPVPKACDVPNAKGSKKRQSFKGKLYFGHDSQMPHVWLYAWYPDAKPPMNTTGGAQFTGHRTKAKALYDQLMATPASAGPRRRARLKSTTVLVPPAVAAPAVVRRGPKKGQRPIPASDPFAANYDKWKTDQKALSQDYGAFRKTDDYKRDTASLLFNRTLKNTIGITSKSPNRVDVDSSAAMLQLEKDWKHLDILTGASGALLGTLRKTFGAAFVKVINIYKTLRDRFATFWEERKKKGFSKQSRLAAAVMKVGGMIFAAIVHHVLPRIGNLLLDCVERGFTDTIEKMFGDEFQKQIGDKITEVEQKLATLEAEIETKVEEAVGNVFTGVTGEYERVLAAWDDIGQLIGIAKTAFNLARVAACAATGIETVGIGCVVAGADFVLSLFDVSPSELLAESLLGTCMAQELIGDYVLSLQEVKDFPTTAAQKIVDFVGPALPTLTAGSYTLSLKDLLCTKVSGSVDLPKTSEVTCGQGGSMGGQPSGKDYRLPGTVDPKIFNRAPSDSEILSHGRLPRTGTVPKAPAQPAPGAEQPPPSGAAPSGSGTGDSAPAGAHGIEPGTIGPGGKTVGIHYYIHGIGGGFGVKDYGGKTMTVYVSAVDSDAVYYGPDQADIKVYRVFEDPEKKGRYKMTFQPAQDYKLWFKAEDSRTVLGFTAAKKRWGFVGEPKK